MGYAHARRTLREGDVWAAHAREHQRLGSLICGRDIAPEFEGIIDTVSISLNAPDAKTYQKIVRSSFGEKSFDAVIDFAREVKHYVPNVVMTTVETTISHEDEEKCRAICEKLSVRYRIRAWAG